MRNTRILAFAIAALLATAPLVVTESTTASAAAATCKGSAPSDFNGDGISDVAIGEPRMDGPRGAFHILFGTRSGLTASSPQDQLFEESSGSQSFAEVLAAGDFNGDGCTDLAVTDDRATVNNKGNAGIVSLYQGGPSGLANIDEQLTAADATGGTVDTDGEFGDAAAVGDVNGDGYDDLIIGGDEDTIYVFPGSPAGLGGGTRYVEGVGGVPGGSGGGNEFGLALASGDFDGDGHTDVAIGARAEDTDAGAVVILRGGSSVSAPLTTVGAQLWTQDSTGVPGTAESFDSFGSALATGDFKGNGRTDLAIGVPGEDVGTIKDGGTVDVLYSSGSAGLAGTGAQAWTQDSSGVPGTVEPDDLFGDALAAGDFNGNGRDDLAIGADGESVGTLADAGAVNVLPGSSSGLTGTGSSLWNQDTAGISGTSEFGDRFGLSLQALRVRSSSRDDLVVGVPFETIGTSFDTGMINFIPGSGHGLTATGSQAFDDDSSGVKGASCEDCAFSDGLA